MFSALKGQSTCLSIGSTLHTFYVLVSHNASFPRVLLWAAFVFPSFSFFFFVTVNANTDVIIWSVSVWEEFLTCADEPKLKLHFMFVKRTFDPYPQILGIFFFELFWPLFD